MAERFIGLDGSMQHRQAPMPKQESRAIRWLALGPGDADEDGNYVVDGVPYRDPQTYYRMVRKGLAPKPKDTQYHLRGYGRVTNWCMFGADDFKTFARHTVMFFGFVMLLGYQVVGKFNNLNQNWWTQDGIWFLAVVCPLTVGLVSVLLSGWAYYKHGVGAAAAMEVGTLAATALASHHAGHRLAQTQAASQLSPQQIAQQQVSVLQQALQNAQQPGWVPTWNQPQ